MIKIKFETLADLLAHQFAGNARDDMPAWAGIEEFCARHPEHWGLAQYFSAKESIGEPISAGDLEYLGLDYPPDLDAIRALLARGEPLKGNASASAADILLAETLGAHPTNIKSMVAALKDQKA